MVGIEVVAHQFFIPSAFFSISHTAQRAAPLTTAHCCIFVLFLSTLQIYKVIVQWKMDAVKSCNLGQSIKYSSKLPQMQWNTFNPVFIFATTNTFLQQQIYFSNFSCMFLNPNIFYNMIFNCSNLLGMRNLQEQVEKAFCYQKLF